MAMGEKGRLNRVLLECSLSDKLCGKSRDHNCLRSDIKTIETEFWMVLEEGCFHF